MSDRRYDNEYFQQTEESDRFRQEYEMRRMKQARIRIACSIQSSASNLLYLLCNERCGRDF